VNEGKLERDPYNGKEDKVEWDQPVKVDKLVKRIYRGGLVAFRIVFAGNHRFFNNVRPSIRHVR